MSDEEAFKQSVECITGPISKTISTQGMLAVYNMLDDKGKETFKQVCFATRLQETQGGWRVSVCEVEREGSSLPPAGLQGHGLFACEGARAKHSRWHAHLCAPQPCT